MDLRKTHIYAYHVEHGNIVDFGGYAMPVWYEGIIPEHHAVRNSVGMFGRHHRPTTRFAEVTDGLSNTIMNGETLPRHCIFNSLVAVNFNVYPTNIPLNTMEDDRGAGGLWYRTCGFKSLHPGGANFVMGDASVHFFSQAIDFRLYNNLGTRAGAEVVVVPK